MTLGILQLRIAFHMKAYRGFLNRGFYALAEYHIRRADKVAGEIVRLTDWNKIR